MRKDPDPTGYFDLCICGTIVDKVSAFSSGKPLVSCYECNRRKSLITGLAMWQAVRRIMKEYQQ
jgi:hypothetical protein